MELFHTILIRGYISHAIQEIAIDNELRLKLNKNFYEARKSNKIYFGHKHLKELRKAIYPYWRRYLQNKNENIFQFIKRMEDNKCIKYLSMQIE